MEAEMPADIKAHDPFCIAGTTIGSRLLLGTAGYPNQRILRAAVEASGCEIVTMSIRRISLKGHGSDTIGLLAGRRFLPNTAGCGAPRRAVLTAEPARGGPESGGVKLEGVGGRERPSPAVRRLG